MKYLICILIFSSIWVQTSAQPNETANPSFDKALLCLMQPTDSIHKELPEMVIVADTSQLYQSAMQIVEQSILRDFILIHFFVQQYLKNTGQIDTIEPAYMALTNNQGGYARKGFVIRKENTLLYKKETPYVDIVASHVEADPAHLMSVTQLYPHELGHVMYRLLSADTAAPESKSVDMHYFSIITDYSTAFNEGFAEHLENLARLYEPDTTIKNGIFEDLDKVALNSRNKIEGFKNDFRYPFRLGYYKAGMVLWYQQYEDFKRYDFSMSAFIKFLNNTIPVSNSEDRLTYRNSGVVLDTTRLRNQVQLLKTEGWISALFTHLSKSELGNIYYSAAVYKDFMKDTTADFSPEKIFKPWQNQLLKYFLVMDKYVLVNTSASSQFIDFFEGYSALFPNERAELEKIYRMVSGREYNKNLPPEIWMMVKETRHRLLVLDPFGGLTVPVYTFDLNAADTDDLLAIKAVSREAAEKIITYRRDFGYFQQLTDLHNILGLSADIIETIINYQFDDVYFEQLEGPSLDIQALITAPVFHLLKISLFYYVLFAGLLYFLFYKKQRLSLKKITGLLFGWYFYWLLVVLIGLACSVFFNSPFWILLASITILITLTFILARKNQGKQRIWLFAQLMMGIVVCLSLL